MKTFDSLLESHRNKKLVAIFAHPDDESFLTGGLLLAAKKYRIHTELICLTKGEKGKNALAKGDLKKIRTTELKKASETLQIDKVSLHNYPDAGLIDTKKEWTKAISERIKKSPPDIILTFDHGGMTGHPDHIIVSVELLKMIRKMKIKPLLLWRVPGAAERKLLGRHADHECASAPNLYLKYGFLDFIRKMKAVFAHRSQMRSFLHILKFTFLMFVFRAEYYCEVDPKKKYKHKFVHFEI